MRLRSYCLTLALVLLPATALAQSPPRQGKEQSSAFGTEEESRALRKRFGAGMAERLLRQNDDDDERLRGIARASADGSPEAIGLLSGLQDVSLRSDPRAMIELARALAPYVDQESARVRLLALVGAAAGAGGKRGDDPTGDDPVAKVELARNTAALAIASSGDSKGVDDLIKLTRQSGIGQLAAANALLVYGVSPFSAKLESPTSPTSAWLYAESGDLRLLESLLTVASSPGDSATRQVALRGLAQAGDQRATELAKRLLGLDDKKSPADPDSKLRVAAAEALTLLDAPARYGAVASLLRDNVTLADGVRFAERVQSACATHPCASADISSALAKLIGTFSDPTFRESVVAALGRGNTDEALTALIALLSDARLGPAAAQALARSAHPSAMAAIEKITDKRLALRAYVLRRITRGERSGAMEELANTLSHGKDPRDRALGTFANVSSDLGRLDAGLADPDAHVRRMAAMGARANPSADTDKKLLAALADEKDDATRMVLAGALASGDPSSLVPTLTLVDRAEAGGPDAPVAALALAARTRLEDDTLRDKVSDLLTSRDPNTRAHIARGLGMGPATDASGMLANAYRYEVDGKVRRAIVLALASREADASSPSRVWALRTASKLDPDAIVRLIARRALAGLPPNPTPVVRECAWIRVIAPPDAPMPKDLTGSYLGADGSAIPFAFDEDGFALVLSVPPGEGRLVLAPRVP